MKNWLSNYIVWMVIAIAAASVIAAGSLFLAGKVFQSVAVLAWVAVCYLLLRLATCREQGTDDSSPDDSPDVQPH